MGKATITRAYILEKAFEQIYRNGYQATSVDKIIDTTDVTKGAFYYHFKNKEEMGLAVINEVVYPNIKKALITPLDPTAENPIDNLYRTIKGFMLQISEDQLAHGCPTNNLIQELAFTKGRVSVILDQALEEGYQIGYTNEVQKGMSGGALLTIQGFLVGVNGKHAYPLWEAPDFYEDQSQPCPPLQELIIRSSLAIPLEKIIDSTPEVSWQSLSATTSVHPFGIIDPSRDIISDFSR